MEDLTGQRFGRLVVIGLSSENHKGRSWSCHCDCGLVVRIWESHLVRVGIRSCGCLRPMLARTGRSQNPNYRIWQSARSRCSNPQNKSYPDYGGRGIEMCARWAGDFELFDEYVRNELGPRPSEDHQLDRINNEGNYEPGNIRWATRSENMINRRNVKVRDVLVLQQQVEDLLVDVGIARLERDCALNQLHDESDRVLWLERRIEAMRRELEQHDS